MENRYKNYIVDNHSWSETNSRFDVEMLSKSHNNQTVPIEIARSSIMDSVKQIRTNAEADVRSKQERLASVRVREIGCAAISSN